MKLSLRIISALALALFASASLRAADPVEIKQRWQAGKKYYQTMQTEQQSRVEIAGQKMDQTSSMTIELTMTVAPQAPGQPKRMTIRYARAAMQLGMNGQKMGFDSADPGASSDPLGLAKTLGGTVGKELKVVLNDQDEVTDVENFDEFMKNLAPSAVPGFDPAKMFSREALSHMLQEGGLHALPGKPVAVGESWPFNTQVDLPQLGKVGMTGTYTLKSLGEHDGIPSAEISTEGTISMDLAAAAADGNTPGLAALGLKVSSGSVKGAIWFDPQLGMARDTQLVQEMTISMKNPLDPTATIDVPMKQAISVKLTKVEDVK